MKEDVYVRCLSWCVSIGAEPIYSHNAAVQAARLGVGGIRDCKATRQIRCSVAALGPPKVTAPRTSQPPKDPQGHAALCR